jgi:hypothetical protein
MNKPEHIEGAGRDACRDCQALLDGLRVAPGPHPYQIREVTRTGAETERYRCLICDTTLSYDETEGSSWSYVSIGSYVSNDLTADERPVRDGCSAARHSA